MPLISGISKLSGQHTRLRGFYALSRITTPSMA
jgi:hypothetical protein